MASDFEVIGAMVVAERLTPDTLEDRQRIWLRALPSGVAFPVDASVTADLAQVAALAGAEVAPLFNQAFTIPGVIDMTVNEDLDNQGFIRLTVTVAIDSSSGKTSTERTVAYSASNPDQLAPVVAQARAELDALEAV